MRPADASMFEHIQLGVNAAASSESTKTKAEALAMMEERFDVAGRALYRSGDPYVPTLANYQRWLEEIGNKRTTKADKAAVAKIGQLYSGYNAVVASVNQHISKSYAAAPKTTSPLRVGDTIPRRPTDIRAAVSSKEPAKVWFRSPLTNSTALMRSLSQQPQTQIPLLLPTDPNSNYRTAYVPYSKLGKVDYKFDKAKLAHITDDPSMQQLNGDMTMASVKPLKNEQYVRAKMQFAPIAATFFALDTAKMAEHKDSVPIEGYVGEASSSSAFDIRAIITNARAEAIASGLPFTRDDEQEAIAEAMNAHDAERATRGLKPADYTAEFSHAATDARSADMAARVAAVRASALSSMQTVKVGVREGETTGGISLGVIENARRNARSMQSAGARIRTKQDVQSARYAQAMASSGQGYAPMRRDNVGDSQGEFDINNVNREFNARLQDQLERDEQEANADYMATDEAYRADDRTAHFRETVGYDRRGVRVGGSYPNDSLGAALRTLQSFGWTAAPPPRATQDSANSLHQNVVYRTQKANSVRNALLRAAYLALLSTPNTYTSWHSLIDQDVHVPINFLVWRLWIELEMYSCILLQSGIETGANVLGHTNMVFSNTSVDKMMHGHFTYHHACMIWKQQFVNVLKNVMPGGYIAGWNTEFIESSEEIFTAERNSIIVTAIPITEHGLGRKLCFIRTSTPRLLPSITDRPKMQTGIDDYSTAGHSELTWDLSETKLAQSNAVDGWSDSSDRINVVAMRGTWFSYNPASSLFSNKHHGKGHLSGNRTGPTVRKVFIGGGNGRCGDQILYDAKLELQ
jgi:hypothetical protein